jgi:glutathione S-transferase
MKSETFTLQLSRFIRAPREQVFDAFVTKELMSAWMCPRGMHIPEISADARVDGAWRIDMRARRPPLRVGGHYRELRRPERVAYTWQWEGEPNPMPGVQTLIDKEGGTELRMTHTGFPAEAAREAHQHGWTSCLNKLNDLVGARGSAGRLTLLGDARSTYTRTARMAFAEKGIAITLQPCRPHSPELLALHPFGRIPALRDGDTAVWETSAILRYADECFDGPLTLTPSRISDRVVCDQWVSAVNCYLYDTMVRRYVLQYVFPKGEGGQPDRGVIAKAVGEMATQLAALERAYGRSDFLAGGGLSCADLFVAPILAYVETLPEGARLLSDMPNTRRAQAGLRRRCVDDAVGCSPRRSSPMLREGPLNTKA